VQRHRRLGQQLQAPAERALGPPHALADRVDLPELRVKSVKILSRFAEVARAEHDRVGRVRAFD